MIDTTFIITATITPIVMILAMWGVYHYTRSILLMIASSFIIAEMSFIFLAMNSEGFYLWFCAIILIPIAHFAAWFMMGRNTYPTKEL